MVFDAYHRIRSQGTSWAGTSLMGSSKTTPIKNNIAQINIILQHNSVISNYSEYVTDSVTAF